MRHCPRIKAGDIYFIQNEYKYNYVNFKKDLRKVVRMWP